MRLLRTLDAQTVATRVASAKLPNDFGQPLTLVEKDIEFGHNIGPELGGRSSRCCW